MKPTWMPEPSLVDLNLRRLPYWAWESSSRREGYSPFLRFRRLRLDVVQSLLAPGWSLLPFGGVLIHDLACAGARTAFPRPAAATRRRAGQGLPQPPRWPPDGPTTRGSRP